MVTQSFSRIAFAAVLVMGMSTVALGQSLADINKQIAATKAKIESSSSPSQTDMMKLQSLINKRAALLGNAKKTTEKVRQ